MAKTFKEIRIYGALSFPRQEHPYLAMDCQFNGGKENREAPLHVIGPLESQGHQNYRGVTQTE
jgi:hypothetical protein